jgi:biotin synthase-like enzyme
VPPSSDALRTIAAFRLALPRTVLCYAGGRELTLGDLGTEAGMLGGINAIIVGNYLTTLGRPAQADLEMLSRLRMPIKALSALSDCPRFRGHSAAGSGRGDLSIFQRHNHCP